MFELVHNWRRRRILRRSSITSEQWQQAFAALPLLTGITSDEKQRLQELAILFLHAKTFEGVQGVVVSQSMTLLIALQACLPILNLGLDSYDGWSEIVIYPSGFSPIRTYTDEAGVVHRERDNLAGESWQRGPVILAGDAIAEAGVIDGHNLVIHEFAHKLDMQNGVANGFPPLHSNMQQAAWVEAFSISYEDLQQKCLKHKSRDIDCYAATAPAEFFAVMSEIFFERPNIIQKHYADIYDLLRQYYRQDPLTRLS